MLATTDRPGARIDVFSAVRRTPVSWAVLIAVGALLVVFEADRTTGSAPVQHLYYLAIAFAGARFGYLGGATTALAAAGLYHLANPRLLALSYSEGDVVQIALFISVGLVAAKLALDARHVHRLAMTDDLTGLHNLRSFEVGLERILGAMIDEQAPLALMVLDVDRLKSLNDRYGHLAGADSVRTVGQLIAAWSPPGAIACRYGGDEFVVAVPRCSKDEAIDLADHLRQSVNSAASVLAGLAFPAGSLSVSIGVACWAPADTQLATRSSGDDIFAGERLFRAADEALYRAKANGRNRTAAA